MNGMRNFDWANFQFKKILKDVMEILLIIWLNLYVEWPFARLCVRTCAKVAFDILNESEWFGSVIF